MIPSGLGGRVGCDLVVRGRGRGGRGAVVMLFEAVPAGAAEGAGQSKRLEQITVLLFNYSQPYTTSLLFVFTALAYHRIASREHMEMYQGRSLSLPLTYCWSGVILSGLSLIPQTSHIWDILLLHFLSQDIPFSCLNCNWEGTPTYSKNSTIL